MKDPEIKPEWRTSTVLDLCRSMRETQGFSAMPILADALQDADCDDDELLERLRAGPIGYFADTRLIAFVLLDDAAESVQWLEALAAELGDHHGYNNVTQPMNYTVLMDAARNHILTGEILDQIGSDDWRDSMHGRYTEFWRHYQIITGVSPDKPESFISCSC